MTRSRLPLALIAVAAALAACSSSSGTPEADGGTTAAQSTTSNSAPAPRANGLIAISADRSLFVDCQGSGSPTVVFESGMGEGTDAWSAVRDLLPTTMRTCAYDRAGNGSSPSAGTGRTTEDVVSDLEALLSTIGEEPPYVLVGFSIGGLFTQAYAAQHPTDVAGIVLVDSVHPEEAKRFEPHLTAAQIAADHKDLAANPEGLDFYASMDEAQAAGPLPDVPTIVLTAGRSDGWPPGWDAALFDRLRGEMQKELASGPSAKQRIIDGAGHDLLHEAPDAVAKAIEDVVAGEVN